MSAAALHAGGLTVRYGTQVALEDVSFDVPAGATVAVLGPNGSGKSTLFSAAVGLLKPAGGRIAATSRRIAYLPQQLDVDPAFPVTVAEVVMMGRWGELGWVRRPGHADRKLVNDAMERLALGPIAHHRVSDLSGGQRQRALIAQAVAQQPELLLLDEPFTGVDAPTAIVIRELIEEWAAQGRTVLVATHDLEAAMRDFDLTLALNRTVIAFGPSGEQDRDAVLTRTFGDAPAVEGAGHHIGPGH